MQTFATERGTPEPVAVATHDAIEQVRDQAMFLIDRHGRIASWNEGVSQILGWDKADWIGQPLAVAFTPQDVIAGVHEDEMRHAAASGRADDDRWMRRKNGEHFFALGAMTRVLDGDGVLVGYLKMLRDFTDAKKAAQERERLLVSESQARALAENQGAALTAAVAAMADGVFIGDADGVQRCNDAARRMLGAQAAQDLPLDVETLLQCLRIRRERHGPLLSAGEFPFTRALHGHTEVLEVWATRLDDGQDVFLRSAAAPIAVDGQVVGAVAVHSDLTEHLRLHEQGHDLTRVQNVLHERNAELRALADGVRDYAIFTVNEEGRIASWHEGAALMKGYTAEEAIGMPFADLFTPEDRAAGRPAHEMAMAAATGEYKGDGQRLRKDGSTFEAAVVLTALRGPRHELLGYLKLTQDITERMRLEREREAMLQAAQAARSQAERTSHSKGEFLATISHELRTPLSAILGWAHVLDRGVFDLDTVKHGLAAISRNARIQVQLIEDLLDMNRIESGQLRLDLQRVELGGVIAAAIDSALPAATAKGIGLRTAFGPDSGAVMGDAARLQQVVANLLNNAIKFTPEGGQVSVALTQNGAQAQIVVSDNGQGIAPDFLAHIFDRFQQQDATTTRRHGGLGIGLAIVRNLVQLHGGSVTAHSRGNGHGATFTVTLPALTAATGSVAGPASTLPTAQGQTEPMAAQSARLDGLTVLLVDDEPDVRAITARVLQDVGAQVLAAGNAGEGLALLRSGKPAVILSDIGMPEVDGYDFMRRVRALPDEAGGQTPAASFTAYTRPEDHQRALAAGYQMHLDKPVSPDALVSAVSALAALAGYGSAAASFA